jgi:general secretion pathway protein F
MPAYKFEALDAQRQVHQRPLEADNARAARAQLRAQALVPLDVTPGRRGGTRSRRASAVAARVRARPAWRVWTRQMAGLVGSGLPLERALTALSDEADDRSSAS